MGTPEDATAAEMRRFMRPLVHEFLDFAFSQFSAVGIWTAASQSWLHSFTRAVDPTCKRNWSFSWSGRISRVPPKCPENFYPVWSRRKRLAKIWNNRALRARGYTRHSTLIIENTPELCQSNYGNAIYVKTYGESWPLEEGNNAVDNSDDCLSALQSYLSKLIDLSLQGLSMRSIEKRYWYNKKIDT